MYEGTTASRAINIFTEYFAKASSWSTGLDHTCKGEDIIQKLNQCNYTNEDLGRIFTIMTLPASFENLRTVLTSSDFTWLQVKQKIIEHNNQQSLSKIAVTSHSGQIKINAFNSQSTSKNNTNKATFNPQNRQQGRSQSSSNSSQSNANSSVVCTYCKRINHSVKNCRTKEKDDKKRLKKKDKKSNDCVDSFGNIRSFFNSTNLFPHNVTSKK